MGGKSLFIYFCIFYYIKKFSVILTLDADRRPMSSAFNCNFCKFSNPITDIVKLTNPRPGGVYLMPAVLYGTVLHCTVQVGCIPCLLYIASGSSTDWAHGEVGIGFTTSMELRDTGLYGYVDTLLDSGYYTWRH